MKNKMPALNRYWFKVDGITTSRMASSLDKALEMIKKFKPDAKIEIINPLRK